MNSIDECPPPEALRDLIASDSRTVAASLLRHLNVCPACRKKLGDAGWPRRQFGAASSPPAVSPTLGDWALRFAFAALAIAALFAAYEYGANRARTAFEARAEQILNERRERQVAADESAAASSVSSSASTTRHAGAAHTGSAHHAKRPAVAAVTDVAPSPPAATVSPTPIAPRPVPLQAAPTQVAAVEVARVAAAPAVPEPIVAPAVTPAVVSVAETAPPTVAKPTPGGPSPLHLLLGPSGGSARSSRNSVALSPLADVLQGDATAAILDFIPKTGPAGTSITFIGSGFATTQRVRFFVARAMKDAKFTIVDDQTLTVVAPEYLRAGAEAVIVVETRAGIIAAVPSDGRVVDDSNPREMDLPKDLNFTVVRDGGLSRSLIGAVTVERGGILLGHNSPVDKAVRYGPYFLRRGSRASVDIPQMVYHEPDVDLTKPRGASLRESVPKITISPVGLFRYTAAPSLATNIAAPDKPKSPHITSLGPLEVLPSDIVVLQGSGFTGTQRVFVYGRQLTGGHRHHYEAGFQVVSDRELRVEVPDEFQYGTWTTPDRNLHTVIVITETGATFSVGRSEFKKIDTLEGSAPSGMLRWIVAPGLAIASDWCLVEDGGIATHVSSSEVLFVKRGADLRSSSLSPKTLICYERGFAIDKMKRSGFGEPFSTLFEVPEIQPSIVAEPLRVRGRVEY